MWLHLILTKNNILRWIHSYDSQPDHFYNSGFRIPLNFYFQMKFFKNSYAVYHWKCNFMLIKNNFTIWLQTWSGKILQQFVYPLFYVNYTKNYKLLSPMWLHFHQTKWQYVQNQTSSTWWLNLVEKNLKISFSIQ